MPSINCATGRVKTIGLSSSIEVLLRSERVDFIVRSGRQFGQLKTPLGM
jgi:hypothetical protein